MQTLTQTQHSRPGVRRAKLASFAALSLISFAALMPLRASADLKDTVPPMSIADLQGTWQMTVIGQTGCGFGTTVYVFTLDATGTGYVSATYHTAGCGDGSVTTAAQNQFFVHALNPDGSGTAGLTCGPSCGWELTIQVSSNRQVFNFADVDAANPNNFIEGTAIRRAASGGGDPVPGERDR
jgi:hypothetical protein